MLLVLAALWGGSFVFMRVAVPALGPVPLAFTRVTLAAIALLAHAAVQRRIPDFRTRWRGFAVIGLVNSALPFSLFCFAEQHVSASTGAILNATSPFFGAAAAAIWLAEPLTARKAGGMALGFAGVVVLVGWQPATLTPDVALAVCACLLAALCYALASVYAKRAMQGVPSAALACGSQVTAALFLGAALPFSAVPGPVSTLVALNVAALAIASTAVAYLIYFRLIADVGPSRALLVTFLVPLFGVAWGFVFLGEAVTWSMLAGGLLILAGLSLALRVPVATTTRTREAPR
jgi:drug/metabolite transporter (DMT)-like permease